MNIENVITQIKSVGLEAMPHLGNNAVVVSPKFQFSKDQTLFDPVNCCWIRKEKKVWVAEIMAHTEIIVLKTDENLEEVISIIQAYYELSKLFDGGLLHLKDMLLKLHQNQLQVEIQANKDIQIKTKSSMYRIKILEYGKCCVNIDKSDEGFAVYKDLQQSIDGIIHRESDKDN